MPFTPFTTQLFIAASTPAAGYTVINGTGPIPGLTWTAPTDGQQHRVLLIASLSVATTEVGGQMRMAVTLPNGSTFNQNFLNSQVAGNYSVSFTAQVQAGSTVTVSQNTALTGGAAVLWADLLVA